MKAKNILKKLDYLPRWAWYLLSFFAAGPFGLLAVYLVFHVLKKMEREQAEAEYQAARARHDGHTYRDEECVVTDEETAERERREYAARHAQQERSKAQKAQDHAQAVISDDAALEDVLYACRDALRKIRRANDVIADEALSAQIDSIENSCAQILLILEQRPQLLSQL
ncbi:MAG: hypothetical protein Q4A66_13455, partial [Eubacteriales bacterium]|nr:hypothetical protein [Eubacteriales bacterium]